MSNYTKRHTNFKDRVGEKFITKENYEIIIIEYFNNENCTISFLNGIKLYKKQYVDIKKGSIKNPYHPSVCGVGYLGIGKYKYKSYSNFRNVWVNMIRRCYDVKTQEKQPTYKDVTVCEEWHNFQNFAEWFEENYVEGFVLDKDIICKDCKIYSPETCLVVPKEINNIFVSGVNKTYPKGVFKIGNRFGAQININGVVKNLGCYDSIDEASNCFILAKNNHIKNTAEKWKPLINDKIYNYMVEYVK